MSIILDLEFEGLPPTVNSMYRSSGYHRYKQKAVVDWQENIADMLENSKLHCNFKNTNEFTISVFPRITWNNTYSLPYLESVEVNVVFTTNNGRRWDIDNRLKALLDCLTKAQVIEDDAKIDCLSVRRYRGDKNTTRLILKTIGRD